MQPARVVIVDFPWEYNNRHDRRLYTDGIRNTKRSQFGIGVASRYTHGVMNEDTITEVGRLLHQVTTDDAYLFSWATKATLPSSFRVLERAGWVYATTAFVWVKTNKKGGFFPGAGRYTFSNTEDLQIWRKPKSTCWHANTGWRPRQVVMAAHPRDPHTHKIIHSRKPAIFHTLIELWLIPQISEKDVLLEVFATQKTDGWLCLGGDVTGRDIRDDLRLYHSKILFDEHLTL